MPTYVAFLRAINLGATRKFPKDAIVAAVEAAGCTEVATHINTGNVLLRTTKRSRAAVESALEKSFLADRGFEVPTIAFTPAELSVIAADADALEGEMPDGGMNYVSLLKAEPDEDVRLAAESASTEDERLVVRGRAVHLLMSRRDGYHQATLSNAWIERHLGVATNRNGRVIRDIVAKWC